MIVPSRRVGLELKGVGYAGKKLPGQCAASGKKLFCGRSSLKGYFDRGKATGLFFSTGKDHGKMESRLKKMD